MLVVEGNNNIDDESDAPVDIVGEVQKLIDQGVHSKEAIKQVAKTYNMKKNDVYDMYLESKEG